MKRRTLPGPLYEALPGFYILTGLFALVVSYRTSNAVFSVLLGLAGLVCVLGGIVVWLRRRDFRALRANYTNQDQSVLKDE